jgi:hypothetical protein
MTIIKTFFLIFYKHQLTFAVEMVIYFVGYVVQVILDIYELDIKIL